ncbi:MAG: hypothetical protein IJZ02_07990, partial [Clostridia bacterium]|nr:hypothetical protein [Clostridia bacterium]
MASSFRFVLQLLSCRCAKGEKGWTKTKFFEKTRGSLLKKAPPNPRENFRQGDFMKVFGDSQGTFFKKSLEWG